MNIKDIINATSQLQREMKHLQLNATCPHCEADVLDTLLKAAHDWAGYGPPTSRIFECPHCKEEVEFELGWKTMLYWAMPMVERLGEEVGL